MSELSEQLEETLHALNQSDEEESSGVVLDPGEASRLRHVEYIEEMSNYYDDIVMSRTRRVYRRFAGGAKFVDADQATDSLLSPMMEQMSVVGVEALADGVLFGRKSSAIYKKYRMFDKLDELFGASSFRDESSMYGLKMMEDADAFGIVKRYIEECFDQFRHMSGYCAIKGDDPTVNKIWDLWYLVMKSAVIGLYSTGYTLGGTWEQNETLQGILAITPSAEGDQDA